jgi:hypothetical protein
MLLMLVCINPLSAQPAPFKTTDYFPQINQVRDIKSVDLNGDQLPDLVITTQHDAGIIIYENLGDMVFRPAAQQLSTGEARDALVEDFDGDGDLDIWAGLLSGEFEDLDALYLNDGSGVFTKQELDVSLSSFLSGADELFAADLNQDGAMDVLRTTRVGPNDIAGAAVYLNDGQAGFTEHLLPMTLGRVGVADFNGDGFADIWSMGSVLVIFHNNGQGLFNVDDKTETGVGFAFEDGFTVNPVLADIDGDGDTDIQVFDTQFYLPRVLNNGDGTFTQPGTAIQLFNPGVQVGAFIRANDDAALDLWYSSALGVSSEVVFSLADGQLDLNTQRISIDEQRIDRVHPVDLDLDGDEDVVTVGASGIRVWQQTGLGEFAATDQSLISQKWSDTEVTAHADVNNDGYPDLLVAGRSGVQVALGDALFGFADLQHWSSQAVVRFKTGDLNQDGFQDLIVIDDRSRVKRLMNDQQNHFVVDDFTRDEVSFIYDIELGDVDADGDVDVLVQEFFGSISLYNNDGQAGFEVTQTIAGAFRVMDLVDLNQQGQLVLLAHNAFDFFGETTVGVIQYDYAGQSFTKTRSVTLDSLSSNHLVTYDFDEDGDLDVLTSQFDGSGYVLVLNEEDSFSLSEWPLNQVFPKAVADFNLDGTLDYILQSGDAWISDGQGHERAGLSSTAFIKESLMVTDLDDDGDQDVSFVDPLEGLKVLRNTTTDQDFNGSWYNPAEDGHGLQIEEIATGQGLAVVVSWYVYHNGTQLWLTGTGPVNGDTAEVPVFLTSGPDFGTDYDSGDLQVEAWGSLTLTLTARNDLQLTWDGTPLGFGTGALAMTRLTDIRPVGQQLFAINSCHSGSWYNPDESGHGFMLQVLEDGDQDKMLITWYTYLNGEQIWLTATGPINGQQAVLDVWITEGADFPPAFMASDVDVIPWGELTFTLNTDISATISWQPMLDGFNAGQLAIEPLTLFNRYRCH